MIERLARSREARMKREIFRGIYEDNLRIIGQETACAGIRRRVSPWARRSLVAGAAAAVLLIPASGFSPLHLQDEPFSAGLNASLPPDDTAPTSPPALDPGMFRRAGLPLSRVMGLGVRTILLDPGHGGEDAGASGRMGTKEKDLALDIVRRLRRRLATPDGPRVVLTRDGDRTLSLQDRVDRAREEHADLFVSVHLNYLPTKPINIIETFYFGPSPDAKTVDLARRENAGADHGMSEFRELVEKMGTQLKLEESRALAGAIQASLARNSRRRDASIQDYGVKRAPFYVLLGVQVPAVLAEVSCLSNPEEEASLGTEEHREHIAAYLETGIRDYLRNREVIHESKK